MADADPKPLQAQQTGQPRRFSTADVLAMQDAGLLADDERLELIEGALLTMNAKKNNHEIVKNELLERLALAKRADVRLAVETSLYLASDLLVEPDIILYPKRLLPEDVRGTDALLLIEIADTSQVRDLEVKAPLYAKHGVRDYWVIDVLKRETTIHREPSAEGYRFRQVVDAQAKLTAVHVPEISLTIPWGP
jgi:Uma2 family endonuclease